MTVRYATADGTATAGDDYSAVTGGALTFAAGDTAATITVSDCCRCTRRTGGGDLYREI